MLEGRRQNSRRNKAYRGHFVVKIEKFLANILAVLEGDMPGKVKAKNRQNHKSVMGKFSLMTQVFVVVGFSHLKV